MIVLDKVVRRYLMGETVVTALNGVSLHIKRGEFVSLIGTSGSGKSTLLNMIGLLDRPDSGSLIVAGQDTARLSDDELSQLRSETIGFVFQQFHLLKRMNALDNVRLPLIYAKGDRPAANPQELLSRVGLGERLDHKPNELSGGQQQRVAIARSLIRRPSLVLADEPTGNLDSQSGAEIMRLLRELHAEGLTVVLVTHEPSIAAAADRTIRMKDGQIVEDHYKPNLSPLPKMGHLTDTSVQPLGRSTQKKLLWLSFEQALRGLWSNKFRTALSALGIIIGVAAVIVMLAMGDATKKDVKRQMEASGGANRIVLFPNYQNTAGVRQKPLAVSRLTLDESLHIADRVPSVSEVSGNVAGDAQIVYGHNNMNTRVYGVMPSYMKIYGLDPIFGRYFTMDECYERARVAVIGTEVLAELFEGADPIGKTIEINHVPFTVIGVLQPKGGGGWEDNWGSVDARIDIPVQTAMYRVFGKKYLDWIDVTAKSADDVERTDEQVLKLTNEWPQIPGVTDGSYKSFTMKAAMESTTGVINTISLLLGGVAGISLVVGGIGIMNIMLVSVTERTREIGLRKALGARKKDIQTQFLIESVTLCFSGGCLGILTGWIITLIIGAVQGGIVYPSLFSVLISSSFSVAVGIGFGYWPAVLASRLNPIEALRHE